MQRMLCTLDLKHLQMKMVVQFYTCDVLTVYYSRDLGTV